MSCLKARDIETNPRSVADKSAIGCRLVGVWSPIGRSENFESATGRRSITDQSATSRQSFSDLCNLFANEFSRGQSFVHVQKTARD